ncbi:MAG: GntR family transcriptional regulator, partial [Burkholderiales bacterium]|nr:GntR family transcriptional regulator [Burkholderiales bacterium]
MDLTLARQPGPGSSLQDRIRLAVEAEILSGARPPGSAIDERQLAQQFDASRTPVREALLVLAAQGLVHIAPRSGIYVRRATAAELVATLEALMELEAIVAGLAAKRASAAQCADLRQALAAASARADSDDLDGYAAANAVLHKAIYRASGNPVLVEQVRSVRRTLAAYRLRSTDKPGRLKASDAEHQRIVAAICAGDPAAAADAMRQHINLGGDAMVQLVAAAQAV